MNIPFHPAAETFPLLPSRELQDLAENIKAHGLRLPIALYQGQILDGRHRALACEMAHVEPRYDTLPDETDPWAYVIDMNLHRRHLTESQRAMIAADLASMRQGERTDLAPCLDVSKVSQERAADLLKVSRSLVQQAVKVRREAPPEIIAAVGSGKMTLHDALKRTEKTAQQDRLRREHDPLDLDGVTLIEGDFREVGVQIADASVDLLLTDPPYGQEWLPQWAALGAFAARVLKPGGSLLAMSGQAYLYEVLDALRRHLAYQWTLSYRLHGSADGVFFRKVQNHWKPLLWYVKGAYAGSYIGDVVMSAEDPDKRFHAWGQAEDAFALLIKRFTFPGEVVCDPLCGGGTTGAVAVELRRRFIGIETDAKAMAITRGRLAALAAPADGTALHVGARASRG